MLKSDTGNATLNDQLHATQNGWQIESGLCHPNQLAYAIQNGCQMAVPHNLGGSISHSG